MEFSPSAAGLVPPLRLTWLSNSSLDMAVPGSGSLYGITTAGKVAAVNPADGTQRWESAGTYLSGRLAVQGTRLFAYKLNEGFAFIDDNGGAPTERVVISIGITPTVNASTPVIDGNMIYLAVNRGLSAVHQTEGLKYGTILGQTEPYSLGLIGSGDLVAIDGAGVPTRYHAGLTGFSTVWSGEANGVNAGQAYRPFVIAGNRLVIGVGTDTVAYDLTDGQIAWYLPNVPAKAMAVNNGILYAASNGFAISAISVSDGMILWSRQYMYDPSYQQTVGLVLAGDYLYCGGLLLQNPDAAALMAFRAADGAFAWMSRSVSGDWAAGIPVTDGTQVFTVGTSHGGAYGALPTPPRVLSDSLAINPRILRGYSTDFGTESLELNLPVAARINLSAWRERDGVGARIITNASWAAGRHAVSWNPAGSGGFTPASQFGYLLLDVEEASMRYTQAFLLPVNTLPDIVSHWAKANIEIMLYNKYANGYEDLTFRPDGLVTRAETSTIIAKTLDLEAPSPGFHTKFTDIGGHWARNYIMALEERGIIGGFREPDGTYTFRPDLNITRAEEAKILVGAYSVPQAPPGFVSKFIDIANHWAEPVIKALEAAGYVNGFQEPNGTYTYRPEQNLTRAELCTLVVRILDLSR